MWEEATGKTRTAACVAERRNVYSCMFGVATSDDYKPVTYVGRFPVDVTTLLVAVHAFTMIVGSLLIAFHYGYVVDALLFDSAQVLRAGRVWQIATYAFVHPPSIWFALHLYMLFFFGREVERFIGRRAFVMLYLVLLILPALFLTLLGLNGRILYGDSSALHYGIFVAFAVIYPSMELFFGIQAKWMALVFGTISVLQLLTGNAWPQLLAFLLSIAVAVVFVRSRGVGSDFLWWSNLTARFQRKPKFQVVPRTSPRRVVEPENIDEAIDPILDKISKSGINSLTASERRALDRARNRLLNKSK